MKPIIRTLAAALVATLGTVASAGTITIQEVGNDVVMTGSGTFDTSGLSYVTDLSFGAQLLPDVATLLVGPASSGTLEAYVGVTGPAAWGPTLGNFAASSGSGDHIGIQGFGSGYLFVPTGYAGTALSGQSTFAGQTLATLLLTPGTYQYTWGAGVAENERLTVQIGELKAVPLPPAAWLGLGLLGLIGLGRKRKRA